MKSFIPEEFREADASKEMEMSAIDRAKAFFVKRMPLRENALNSDTRPDSDEYRKRKNARVQSILQDFPWLWSILQTWWGDPAEHVKVSQNMDDLKTLLAFQSTGTRFDVRTFTTNRDPNDLFWSLKIIPPRENDMWAEAVMQGTFEHQKISYIVVVDPIHGKSHPCPDITIYRHPEKKPLNEIVEHLAQLHGSRAQWPFAEFTSPLDR